MIHNAVIIATQEKAEVERKHAVLQTAGIRSEMMTVIDPEKRALQVSSWDVKEAQAALSAALIEP